MLKGDRKSGWCLITASMETTGQCSEKTGIHRVDWAGCNPLLYRMVPTLSMGFCSEPWCFWHGAVHYGCFERMDKIQNVWSGQILPAIVVREPELRQRGSAAP